MKKSLLFWLGLVSALPSPQAPIPEIQVLPGINRKDSVVKKIRYGPHILKKAEGPEKGVKTAILMPAVKKPCVDCTLITMKGGVEFANGTEASLPSVYLHHAAVINNGPDSRDGTCGGPAYDLFFSTGNERSSFLFNNPNSQQAAGYYVRPSDNFLLTSEVINNGLEDREVWVYFTYEYIPEKVPGQQQTKVIWLSADGSTPCSKKIDLTSLAEAPGEKKKLGAGELYPPNEKSFTLKSQPWTSPWTGNFIALGGHIHDGGVNTEIYQNSKLICDSRANYTDSSSHSRHIGSMTGCRSSAGVQAGDKFQIVVNYDFEKNPGLREKDGSLSAIMASATLFIGAI